MRRRNTLVESTQAAAFPDMEFVLLRCPKFYAKENLDTVFPDAAHIADVLHRATESTSDIAHEVHYYLLYTFQPCDFIFGTVSDVESDNPGLSGGDEPSVAVEETNNVGNNDSEKVMSPVMQWRDRSRGKVFQFMAKAKRRLTERLGNPSSSFFMDWADPATGLPACSGRGASTFADADTVEQFFPFKKVMVAGPGGGCNMVEHPRFGVNVYLDAAVIVAPHEMEETLCEAVRSLGERARREGFDTA